VRHVLGCDDHGGNRGAVVRNLEKREDGGIVNQNKTNWLAIILIVGGFIAAKAYVLLRPAGIISMVIGAFLLILTEPAEAH
jgi:hypothetical protein